MLETKTTNSQNGGDQSSMAGGAAVLEAPAGEELDILMFPEDELDDRPKNDESPPSNRRRLELADRFGDNPLIFSTSAYLAAAIRRHLEAHGGDIETEKLVGGVREEMRYALIVPSSNFSSPDGMLKEYSAYMKPLDREQQTDLARIFLEGVAEARAEGRFFGRHKSDLISYRTKHEIVDAFVCFLHGHGYRLRDPGRYLDGNAAVKPEMAEELFTLIIATRDPRPHLRHESRGEGRT